MLIRPEDAIEQAVRFERCKGYQRGYDPDALKWRERLLSAVIIACERHSIEPKALVDRCLELSEHCPTDYDLFKIAESLREAEAWKPQKALACPRCNDSGWWRVWSLHTLESGPRSSYTRKEGIPREVAESLNGKLDPKKQVVYEGVMRCDHRSAEPEWTPEARATHDAKWKAFLENPKNAKIAGKLQRIGI